MSEGSVTTRRTTSATRSGASIVGGGGTGSFCVHTGVSTGPGRTTWTLMPRGPTSSARASEKPMTPNLEAQ